MLRSPFRSWRLRKSDAGSPNPRCTSLCFGARRYGGTHSKNLEGTSQCQAVPLWQHGRVGNASKDRGWRRMRRSPMGTLSGTPPRDSEEHPQLIRMLRLGSVDVLPPPSRFVPSTTFANSPTTCRDGTLMHLLRDCR